MRPKRMLVGDWFRTMAANPEGMNVRQLVQFLEFAKCEDPEALAIRILYQMGANADHSALLDRMFSGKDPLPEPPPLLHSYPNYGEKA